ncbi:siderophore iron transporter [Colletotrichum tofieldiae]|nr:siderophore iron transporter [Colletotrichum tofieldiae]GKT86640.1 siderophore iron transporter [Colletotrichum tofieldiae]
MVRSERTNVSVSSWNDSSYVDDDAISQNAPPGVQKIEVTTKAWSRKTLIIAYVLMWLTYLVNNTQQGMAFALTPYVTGRFQEHSFTATIHVMASLIGGLMRLPLAKVIDIWGRPHGYAFCVALLTAGLVMMAACKNLATYTAAQVFYSVGYSGLAYTLSIFIADTSALKNRGLMLAFALSPNIITAWLGGPIGKSILTGPGLAWGFGIFAIVIPVITMPLFGIFIYNYYQAKNQDLVFDVVGLLLVTIGFALFLLPFNLYQKEPGAWKSHKFIALLVVGGTLIIIFALWERFFAPVKYLPWELLTNRTILGACALATVIFISHNLRDSYYISFLQVADDLDLTTATYIANIYSVGSCIWCIPVGVAIRLSGRFRWLAWYFGVPLTILGVGLMIHFEQPGISVGYIVMCQVMIAFAGGTLVICEEMAVMAVVEHQHLAVVLAMGGMFSSIGGAIGATIAAAIWQNVFSKRLMEYLPADTKRDFAAIYGALEVQRSYPIGSATRNAIIRAYGDTQRIMLIASTAVLVLTIACVAAWKDLHVKEFKQTKGTVV